MVTVDDPVSAVPEAYLDGVDQIGVEVLDDLVQRDYNDSHREIAPLKPAEDGVILDTTGMTLEESIGAIIRIVKEKV